MRRFILIKSLNLKRYNTKDRYIIMLDKEKDEVISVGKVINYSDFNENLCDFHVYDVNSQVIYQPKVLYKNKNGVFYKINGNKYYLSDNEIIALNRFINDSKVFYSEKCVEYDFNMIQKP